MAELVHGLLFRVLIVTAALYALMQIAMPVPSLILVENGFLLSLSGGVTVAYSPIAWVALRARRPTRGHWLGLGIFVSWMAQFGIRILAIFMDSLGIEQVRVSHWRTVIVALLVVGGVLHLVAPNADDGDVGRTRWVLPGIVVGLGIFVVFAISRLSVSV